VNPWVVAPGVAGGRGQGAIDPDGGKNGQERVRGHGRVYVEDVLQVRRVAPQTGREHAFQVPGVGFEADRDIHAAFNMFLTFLKETSARLTWPLAPTLVPKEALRRSPRREAIVMTRVGGIR